MRNAVAGLSPPVGLVVGFALSLALSLVLSLAHAAPPKATPPGATPPETVPLAEDTDACMAPLPPGAGPAWRPSGPPRFLRMAPGGAAVFEVLGCFAANDPRIASGLSVRYALRVPPAEQAACRALQGCQGARRLEGILLSRHGGPEGAPRHTVPLRLEVALPGHYRTAAPDWAVSGQVSWCTADNLRACAWADGRIRRPRASCAEDESAPLVRELSVQRQGRTVQVRAMVGSGFDGQLVRSSIAAGLLAPDGSLVAAGAHVAEAWSLVRPFPQEGCNPRHMVSFGTTITLPPGTPDTALSGDVLLRFGAAFLLATADRRGAPRWVTTLRVVRAR